MIILLCSKCGSHDVSLGKYKNVYYCNSCLEDLELWETRLVQITELPTEPYNPRDDQTNTSDAH